MNTEYLRITCRAGMSDAKLFEKIINQGIDSHLEAFTESNFECRDDQRLVLDFHKSEIPILIRRLEEIGTDNAYSWAEDIQENWGDV